MSLSPPDPETVRTVVAAALKEDLGDAGDITTEAVIPADMTASARLVARSELVVAGLPVAGEVFRSLDRSLVWKQEIEEGERAIRGETLATVIGKARPILQGERTALNFVMRMSGIATAASDAVAEIKGTGAVILDTRKTVPGWRVLDKYSVLAGGARNHRIGLYDAVMIKDTHLEAAGSLRDAVESVLELGHRSENITAEVETIEQLQEAMAAGAGRALLDNMDLETIRECVKIGKGRIVLEASGGLRPGRLREVAATGVDCLSLGWLTHSAPAADIAMEIDRL